MGDNISILLGDMEGIARKNCNGNLSKYLRELVYRDEKDKKNSDFLELLGFISFFSLGITFVIFTLAFVFPIMLLSALFCLCGCGILFITYSLKRQFFKMKIKEIVA